MMTEISLNILDVAENSTRANASLVTVLVNVSTAADTLKVVIADDGCGMTEEQVQKVTDPFFTTRTTRKVGLGVPFFKMAAESSGGSFNIVSEVGVGTTVTAVFGLSNIDRMPLGDISSTMHNLIIYHPETDFFYRYTVDDREFVLDTREVKDMLGGVPLQEPEVSAYIKEYLIENKKETDKEVFV
jgi:anti-sigma regulatory factor (Ser/Thr protein kinase)